MSMSLTAVALVVSLGACTATPNDTTPDAGGPSASATLTKSEGKARCTGTATKSIDGEKRRLRIELAPCRVGRDEAPDLRLKNTGTTMVGYGPGFKLEKKTEAGWRWVNKRQAFTLPLIYLGPGERSEPEEVAVYLGKPKPIQLDPGLYRVTKSIDLTPGKPRPPRMSVSARFRVIIDA